MLIIEKFRAIKFYLWGRRDGSVDKEHLLQHPSESKAVTACNLGTAEVSRVEDH